MVVQSEIFKATKTVSDKIADRAIRHAIYLEQLKRGEVDKIVGLLHKQVVPDLMKQLDQRLENIKVRGFDIGPKTTLRFRQMAKATNEIVRGGIRFAGKQLKEDLSHLALTEAEFAVKTIKDNLPLTVDLLTPSGPMLRSIVTSRPFEGKLLSSWFNELGKTTQNRLMQQLSVGLTQGESVSTMVNRVKDLMKGTKRSAESLVRTATNHVTTQAREMTYVENQDVVKGVQFLATLDHRTTEICISLDGQQFSVSQGPRPPMHHMCRSTTIPITKSWKELGISLKEAPLSTRASMNGQASSKITYSEWLKKQSKEIQSQVLGKGKAELFRQGKYKISKFNGVGNKPITLEQLKKREGLISEVKKTEQLKKELELAKKLPPNMMIPIEGLPPIPTKTRMAPGFTGLPHSKPKEWTWDQWEKAVKGRVKKKIKPKVLKVKEQKKIEILYKKTFSGLKSLSLKFGETEFIGAVDELNNHILQLQKMFPKVKKAMKGSIKKLAIFPRNKALKGGNGIAGTFEFGSKKMQIRLQSRVTEHNRLGLWDVDGSSAGGLRHELGHALDSKFKYSIEEWAQRVHKSFSKKQIESRISVYAATDIYESWAESFCAYTNPTYGTVGKRLPKIVENYMMEVIGKHPNLR